MPSEFTDDEFRKMLRFIADKSKSADKPLAVYTVWREFITANKSKRTIWQLSNRFRNQIVPEFLKMQQFDMDVKVQILFAMNIPIDEQFLQKVLRSKNPIEVDELNMILTYSNPSSGLKLSAFNEHGELLRKNFPRKKARRNLNQTLDGTLDDDVAFLKDESTSSGAGASGAETSGARVVKKRKLTVKPEPVDDYEPAPVHVKREPVSSSSTEDVRAESEDNNEDVQFVETIEFKPLAADLQIQKPKSILSLFKPLPKTPKEEPVPDGPVEVAELLRYLNIMLVGLNSKKLSEMRKKVSEAIKEAKKVKKMMPMDRVCALMKLTVELLNMSSDKVTEQGYSEDPTISADYHQVLKFLRITVLRAIPVGDVHRDVWAKQDEIKGQKVSILFDTMLIALNNILDATMYRRY